MNTDESVDQQIQRESELRFVTELLEACRQARLIDLAACPFCGSSNLSVADSPEWDRTGCFVVCGCGAHGSRGETQQDAIRLWNKRSSVPKASKQSKNT